MCHTAAMQTTPGSAPVPSLLPHLWKSTLVSGVLSLILGILVLAWPGISVLVAAVAFGVYLLITGIAQVAFAFSLHVSAGSRILLFISGAASLVLAVLAFRHFGNAVLLLAIWIGIGFIFRGVATTVSAISDPTLPGRGWSIFRRRDQPDSRNCGAGSAVPVDHHPGDRRRGLVRGHRRVRDRLIVRHSQGVTSARPIAVLYPRPELPACCLMSRCARRLSR